MWHPSKGGKDVTAHCEQAATSRPMGNNHNQVPARPGDTLFEGGLTTITIANNECQAGLILTSEDIGISALLATLRSGPSIFYSDREMPGLVVLSENRTEQVCRPSGLCRTLHFTLS